MIGRQQLINKLRDLGYTYKRKGKRVEIWRRKGGTHCVGIPTNAKVDEDNVMAILRQCGVPENDITAFIGAAKA